MRSLRDPFFLLVSACFLLGALAWGLLLPVHEAPDEQNHYRYMVFLKEQGRLPRQLPLPPEVAGEGHQPPLYYALGAALLKRLDPGAFWVELPNNPHFAFNANPAWFTHYADEGWLRFQGYARGPHLLRAIQVVLPLLSLAALWLGLMALPLDAGARRCGFVLMALNPGFVFLGGALNNDHLVTLFFTLTLLTLLDAERQGGWSWGHSVACGLFLGLGALSKISIFCLFPLALAVAWWRGSLVKAVLLHAVAFAVAGWFYLRNFSLYGDFFGWEMHRLTCAGTVHIKSWHDMGWLWFWLKRSFESFWIVFGWLSFSAPRWWNAFFLGVSLVAALGFWRRSRAGQRPAPTKILVVALLALTAGILKFNWSFDPPEGRYFYPGHLPIGACFALGLGAWGAFRRPLAAWMLAGVLVALNVWIVFYRLIPLYYNV
jgi:hypothetical protein